MLWLLNNNKTQAIEEFYEKQVEMSSKPKGFSKKLFEFNRQCFVRVLVKNDG